MSYSFCTSSRCTIVPTLITSFGVLLCAVSCSITPLKKIGFQTEFIDLNEDHIRISKTEVTNKEYRKFLDAQDNFKYIYDSTRWESLIEHGDGLPMKRNYHWHPAYDDYPVVNISYEAATAYCEWLTGLINAKNKNNLVLVRLTHRNEFEILIDRRKHLIQGNYHDDYNCDFKMSLKHLNLSDNKVCYPCDGGTFMIDTKEHDQLGLNSIIGNVSEICSDGSSLGGNWDTFPEDVLKPITYTYPDPRIGFRIVIEKLADK